MLRDAGNVSNEPNQFLKNYNFLFLKQMQNVMFSSIAVLNIKWVSLWAQNGTSGRACDEIKGTAS